MRLARRLWRLLRSPFRKRSLAYIGPERTARKSMQWDVKYKVWTSRGAMLKTIEMQEKGPTRADHWRPCKRD